MQNQMVHRAAVRRRRSGDPGGLLEEADRGLGLVVAAAGLQEADRLGQVQPDDDGVGGGDHPHGQRPAPAVLGGGRDDGGADDGRDEPPERPEGLEPDDHAPPDPSGRVLGDQGGGDGELGAQAEPDEEAQDHEHRDGRREGGDASGHTVEDEGQGEDLAPSDPVGDLPAQDRAQGHADEPDGGDPPGGRRREVPVGGQGDHDEGDEADVHRVERPPRTRADEEFQVAAGEGQDVEAFRTGYGRPGVGQGGAGHGCAP